MADSGPAKDPHAGGGASFTLSPYPLQRIAGLRLPAAFDVWRREGYLLPPLDQARCGACYVFAAVAQLADRLSIATGRRLREDLSTQYVLSCLQTRYEYGCGGTLDVPPIYAALTPAGFLQGTFPAWVFPFSGSQRDPAPDAARASPCYYTPGAPECAGDARAVMSLPPHCYPPLPKTGMRCTGTVPCDVAYVNRWYPDVGKRSFAAVFHLSENSNARHLYPTRPDMEHFRLSDPAPMTGAELGRNTQRIKESVYRHGPVTAIIPIFEDLAKKIDVGTPAWGSPDYVYSADPSPLNRATGLHHVLIVGWGDGYWIIKNSWGVWWNYAGYFNARMGDPRLLVESNCHSGIPSVPAAGRGASAGRGAMATSQRSLALVVFFILVVMCVLVFQSKQSERPSSSPPAPRGTQ